MLAHQRKTVGMINALQEESWCKYQADKANGTKLYKPGKGLDTTIIKHIKLIFVDLCEDELLKKMFRLQKHKIKMRVLMALCGIDYKKLPMSGIINFH